MSALACRHVVFDLDGTLTVAAHDFEAIKRELGLPLVFPILESLARLPAPERAERERRLDAIELEIARRSVAALGAHALLERLRHRGCNVGIVTRNSRVNALATLEATGLDRWIMPEEIVGRYEAPAKPAPEGIRRLLDRWNACPTETAMVGDYRFDIEAGRAAGVYTVLVCASLVPTWGRAADHWVASLEQLWP